jgi:hypothetical protein
MLARSRLGRRRVATQAPVYEAGQQVRGDGLVVAQRVDGFQLGSVDAVAREHLKGAL